MKGKIIDFYDDKYLLHLKGNTDKLPRFVKQAEVKDKSQIDDFALRLVGENGDINDKFPIDSKENTMLSDFYFNKTASLLSPTAKSKASYYINQAKIKYGIVKKADNMTHLNVPENNVFCMLDEKRDRLNNFSKLASTTNKNTKQDGLKDSDYALVKTAGTSKKRFCLINYPEQVKVA